MSLHDASRPAKPFDKYAWPGGYPCFAVMADGEALCIDCANTEEQASFDATETDWRIVALDINWEDDSLYCSNCNQLIESAYGET